MFGGYVALALWMTKYYVSEYGFDLKTAAMVVDHGEFQGATHVLAADPKHPNYGTIELIFAENPVALTQWIITDDIGNQTSVVLSDLRMGGTYPESLFSISTEASRRNPRN
ncbi:MAG: hypothetical protein B7Y02_14825 [Rhodobacterales bacterium 17-64-5]|nr:MAG: hypothetical protein B7Y02_14825 [Rhodobacterales bacterium 17-64-5]